MNTQRLSFDMPSEEHKYLKMCCAKLGISIKDFIIKATIEKVEAYEDEWWLEKHETQQMLKDYEEGENFVLIEHDGTIHAI